MATEAEKRARIEVCYEGLLHLISEEGADGDAVKRSHLFALRRGPMEKSADHVKAMKSATWQKEFVKRLLADGIVKRERVDNQDRYTAANIPRIKHILKDHDDFGLLLSKYLFPSEVTIPVERAEPEANEPQPETPQQSDSVDIPDDPLLVIYKLTERMSKALVSLVPFFKILTDQSEALSAEMESDREGVANVKNRMKGLETQVSQILSTVSNTSALVKENVSAEGVAEAVAEVVAKQMHQSAIPAEVLDSLKQIPEIKSMATQSYAKICALEEAIEQERADRTLKAVRDLNSGIDLMLSAIETLQEQKSV